MAGLEPWDSGRVNRQGLTGVMAVSNREVWRETRRPNPTRTQDFLNIRSPFLDVKLGIAIPVHSRSTSFSQAKHMTSQAIFQHRFENIEDYIHHRAPYLLVNEIVQVQDNQIHTRHTVSEDAFFIKGHFPGAPIMPGAMMQELSTQSAGILIAANFNPMETYDTHDPFFNEYALGVLVKIKQARYRGFARPGDVLDAEVKIEEQFGDVFDFSCTISNSGNTIMKNSFQLMNIKSSTLQGKS